MTQSPDIKLETKYQHTLYKSERHHRLVVDTYEKNTTKSLDPTKSIEVIRNKMNTKKIRISI